MFVYLLRHGQDTLDKRGGWSREPLTSMGIEQVKETSNKLKGIQFDKVLSSDLIRTVETTKILKDILNLKDIVYYQELREVNNGILAGMDNEIAEKRFPGLYWNTLKWDENYPNGESPKAFYERVKVFWERIKKETPEDSTILIVAHQGVFEVIQNLENGTDYTNKKQSYTVKTGEFVVLDI
ncbi:histidine phosphatase family protein [Macrococcus lamae]|uniref:Histidine phosphatase family protein n=1 Tax=Macrococcus lamae TaxID=198484 RepID=A0A4R6BS21_9STAP|nr:histidine phosphatase family protein [Macrococcus lamae]TDM05168.1 histidine phosphatase family protein [Macrococcus lamae]